MFPDAVLSRKVGERKCLVSFTPLMDRVTSREGYPRTIAVFCFQQKPVLVNVHAQMLMEKIQKREAYQKKI